MKYISLTILGLTLLTQPALARKEICANGRCVIQDGFCPTGVQDFTCRDCRTTINGRCPWEGSQVNPKDTNKIDSKESK